MTPLMPSIAPPRLSWTEGPIIVIKISCQRVQGHQRSVVKCSHSVGKNTHVSSTSLMIHLHSIISGKKSAKIIKIYHIINSRLCSLSHAFVQSRMTCFLPSFGYLDGNSNRCGTNTRNTTNSHRYTIPGQTRSFLAGHWVLVELHIRSVNPLFKCLCMFYEAWLTSALGNTACAMATGISWLYYIII